MVAVVGVARDRPLGENSRCQSQPGTPKEDSPVERLSALLGSHVQFAYTALDRIVLNGYLYRLQRTENLVHFFHTVAQVPCIDPAALASRTTAYRDWVRQYTDQRQIPVLPAPKGARKEE